MGKETEERIVTLSWLRANAIYFVIDKKERKSMAICWVGDKDNQSGYQFYQRRDGWEFNPVAMHSSIIEWYLDKDDRYDLTANLAVAIENCRWG